MTFRTISGSIISKSRNPEIFDLVPAVKMADEPKFVLRYGCAIGVGGRPYQEDRLVITKTTVPDQPDSYFFAVFDGHGGDRVSSFLSSNFHQALSSHPKYSVLPISALQDTWLGLDDKCYNELRRVEEEGGLTLFPSDGSTGTVCMVTGNDIYVTNCGDSACYSVATDGKFSLLTEDHGTGNQLELDRCIKAGGTLKEQIVYTPYPFPLCCASAANTAKPRIMPGGLLVTRAFGDFSAKVEYLGGRKGVVIPSHGRISYLNAGKTLPKYIILASDGIWDALTVEEIGRAIDKFYQGLAQGEDVSSPAVDSGSPSKVHPHPTAQSIYINADLANADPELTKLAACLVHTAENSPKWAELGTHLHGYFNTCCCTLFFSKKKKNFVLLCHCRQSRG